MASILKPVHKRRAGDRTRILSMRTPQVLAQIWKHLGPNWIAFRLGYAARLRTGLLERSLPVMRWDDQPLGGMLRKDFSADEYFEYRRTSAPTFFFSGADRPRFKTLFARWDSDVSRAVTESEELFNGWVRMFGGLPVQAGSPPDWHRNPLTGERAEENAHWTQVDEFDRGDIRVIWELSRFGWAFA